MISPDWESKWPISKFPKCALCSATKLFCNHISYGNIWYHDILTLKYEIGYWKRRLWRTPDGNTNPKQYSDSYSLSTLPTGSSNAWQVVTAETTVRSSNKVQWLDWMIWYQHSSYKNCRQDLFNTGINVVRRIVGLWYFTKDSLGKQKWTQRYFPYKNM